MFEVELKAEALQRSLDRVEAGATDLSPLMSEIAEYLLTSTEKRFGEGAGPDGTPWAPKSEATIKAYERSKETYSLLPLIRSGDLRRTISSGSDSENAFVGSGAIQAAVMQFGAAKGAFGTMANGSSIPWGTIPARPFLGLSEEDEVQLVAIVEDWLESLIDD
ncbi:MAG: phage virion morphogenesis protein [Jannaschia sp.]